MSLRKTLQSTPAASAIPMPGFIPSASMEDVSAKGMETRHETAAAAAWTDKPRRSSAAAPAPAFMRALSMQHQVQVGSKQAGGSNANTSPRNESEIEDAAATGFCGSASGCLPCLSRATQDPNGKYDSNDQQPQQHQAQAQDEDNEENEEQESSYAAEASPLTSLFVLTRYLLRNSEALSAFNVSAVQKEDQQEQEEDEAGVDKSGQSKEPNEYELKSQDSTRSHVDERKSSKKKQGVDAPPAATGAAATGYTPWIQSVYLAADAWAKGTCGFSPASSVCFAMVIATCWQLSMYIGTLLVVVFGRDMDGVCPVDVEGNALRFSDWAKGSWFSGLAMALGRRAFWGSSASGVGELVEKVEAYSSALAVLASLQLVDLIWATQHSTGVEEVCKLAQEGGELFSLAWAGICLLGWYAAWDSALRRAEGREGGLTVLSVLNPVGVCHEVLIFIARQYVTCLRTIAAKRASLVGVLCIATVLSWLAGWGGFGGMRSAVLLAGVAGISNAVAVDRLLWVGWMALLLGAFPTQVKDPLLNDGFQDASSSALIFVIVLFAAGRDWKAEKQIWREWRALALLEPVGFAIAYIKQLSDTRLSEVQSNPLLDALLSSDPLERVKDVLEGVNEETQLKQTQRKFKDGRYPLDVAIALRNIEVMRVLMNAKADINRVNSNGLTALQVATAESDTATAQVLVTAKADVNIKDNDGNIPLVVAAHKADWAVVRALVEAKSDLNQTKFIQPDKKGKTPLIVAAANGDLATVRMLTEVGVDLDVTDGHTHTALCEAVFGGYVEVVETLVAAKADIDVGSWGGRNLPSAAEHGKMEMLRALLASKADVNWPDSCDQTALYLAAEAGHVDMVRVLIEAKADITLVEQGGQTPLYAGAKNLEVTRMLVEAKANVNKIMISEEGDTPLFRAVQASVDVVQFLLDAKADVNQKNRRGQTPLAVSVHRKKHMALGIVSTLLAAKANPTIPDKKRQTVLSIAAEHGSGEIVRALVDAKANVNAADVDGYTALCIAAEKNNLGTVRGLLEARADVNKAAPQNTTPIMLATGSVELTKALVEAKADVNKGTPAPLIHHAQSGHADRVRCLAEAKADVNRVTSKNETALYMAATLGHAKVVRCLLEFKADFSIANKSGKTPLMDAGSAWKRAEKGKEEVIRLLQAAGATN